MPLPSAADTIARAVGSRPRSLISSRSWSALLALAGRLPAPLASKIYLECHLAGDGRRADLIVGLGEEGREIIAGVNPALAVATPPSDPVWTAVHSLCRLWPRAEALRAGLQRCWLEFDQPGAAGGALPTPALFLDLEPDCRHAELLAALRDAPWLEALVDVRRPGLWQAVGACVAALPAGAFVSSLGFLPMRSRDRLRLCVAGLRARDCADFLRAVAWPGRPEPVRPWLERLAARAPGWPATDRVVAHLDLGRRLDPQLGVELRMGRRCQLGGTVGEGGLLEALVADGLCAEAEQHAIEAWAGARLDRLPSTLWPSVVIKRINHVKLCFHPERTVAAKAYLSVHAVPWPSGRAFPDAAPHRRKPTPAGDISLPSKRALLTR